MFLYIRLHCPVKYLLIAHDRLNPAAFISS